MTAFAVLSLLVLSSVSWTGTDAAFTLLNDSKPVSYILHLEPDFIEDVFEGSIIINVTMMITSSVLVMHQKNLMIDTVHIDGIPVNKWDADDNMEILIMRCKSDLLQDHSYRITIQFKGILTESKHGFYKSKYVIGNETRWIATTHFEPTFARLAFPCWDEPKYKAVFNISIKHSSNHTTVLSNMPVLYETYNTDGTITTYFERSMLMSTYLVAFIVSDYAYKNHDDDRIKIFTKPDSVNNTELAYNFSLEALKVMDEYTEIPYFTMNSKIDQATVRDIHPNAMENWGLVTYRENILLYEEGVSTSIDKYNVISTISHELAHMWFGNLVSPKWWKFIWLNEGFANYFQYFIVDKVKPSLRFMDLYPVEAMQQAAFPLDGKTARPMNQNADHPHDIAALFDAISYDKAGCVIRMLSHTLSEKVFHTALKNYLREYSYGVADSDNLIRHFQDAAGQNKTWGGVPLMEIVRPWIVLSGYPMVTVNKSGPGNFTLSQKQFLYYDTDNLKKWWIPITYATNRNLNFTDTSVTHWMKQLNSSLTILEPEVDWILVNKQQTGYYRVNYDHEIWQNLTEYLKSSNMHRIHPVNRAQLIDDALEMARINHTKYETALNLTLYLYREIDHIPWMSAFKNLEFLLPLISHSKNYTVFKHYIKYIMHSLTKNVTYMTSPKDSHSTKILKLKAMKWACLADVKECVDEAHKEFNAWLKDPKHRLDPDLKGTILCTGLRTASEAVWDEVLSKLLEETFDRDGKNSPLEVMGCSNNRKILKKFLILSARPNGNIRFETAAKAVLANTNVTGVAIIMDIFNFDFMKIMNMNDFENQLESVVKQLSASVTNDKDYLRLSSFVEPIIASDSAARAILSQSMKNINWISHYERIIEKWLLQNEDLFTSSGTEKIFTSLLLIFSIFNTMPFKIFL